MFPPLRSLGRFLDGIRNVKIRWVAKVRFVMHLIDCLLGFLRVLVAEKREGSGLSSTGVELNHETGDRPEFAESLFELCLKCLKIRLPFLLRLNRLPRQFLNEQVILLRLLRAIRLGLELLNLKLTFSKVLTVRIGDAFLGIWDIFELDVSVAKRISIIIRLDDR